MLLNQNKKAKMMEFVIGLALLIVSFFIIWGIWNMIFSKAEGATAEQLCRNFNAGRTSGEVKWKEFTLFNLVPRTCKRLDKIIPSDDYPQTVEGTMSEIGYLVARCWWQWLEGTQDDIFEETGPWGKNKCFVCYSFNIKKGINTFKGVDLKKFLDEHQYIVKDTSDICNVNGGGHCKLKEGGCSKDEEQIPSSRCPKMEINGEMKERICCNKNIECENKGGICSDKCEGNLKEYQIWSCKGSEGEKCCIESDNFLSYTDYVQIYMGEGAIVVGVDEFQPLKETYAITYISKTSVWGDLRRTFGEKDPFPEDEVNTILVSRLNNVDQLCDIEPEISGT